ncbi:hypothetical protein SNE40_018755 [Patella caerulea]|uniref:Tectonin beta-propeller repeat-containing protein 1 n=1 Tax=Patella caerulea TaxID=87958 RepID=A0AAN8J5H0_PATCE
MAKQRFWIVNSSGNVFTLCTENRYFKEVGKDQGGIKIKRVSACESCAWGIGHDQQVYTYICTTDVPIRVVETIYENQRWAPWSGFSNKNLLRTDRSNWSNESGDQSRTREELTLPSEYWEWEEDWFIDENFKGEVTDRGGWQYATDFPRQYSPEPKTLSMVRKRKWLRFRKYVATGKWAKINVEDIEVEDNSFIDIAVGGFNLPGQPPGFLSVWTITINGKVYVRKNVCINCPEGDSWEHIPTDTLGLVNISVGPTGLVWAVTWDGLVLVRLGINRDNVYGATWCEIPYPKENTRMMQIALGTNSLWALSREGKVWFRKGIDGDQAWFNKQSAIGTSWVEMVGEFCHISLTPNDQVFAIGLNDRKPYFRTGVNASDLGGKTWQPLFLQEDINRLKHASSSCSQSLDETDDVSSEYTYLGTPRGTPRGTPISMTSIPEHDNFRKTYTSDKTECLSIPMCAMVPTTNTIFTNSEKSNCDINLDNVSHVNQNINSTLCDDIFIKGSNLSNISNEMENISNGNTPISTGTISNNNENVNSSDVNTLSSDGNTPTSNGNTPISNGNNSGSIEIGTISNDNGNIPEKSAMTACDNNESEIKQINNNGKNIIKTNSDDPFSDDRNDTESDEIMNFVTDIDEDDEPSIESDNVNVQSNFHVCDAVCDDTSIMSVDKTYGTEEELNVFPKESINMLSMVPCKTISHSAPGSISVTPTSEIEVTEMFTLTPAMPRHFWVWFSGMGCYIEDPSSVKWLQTRRDSESSIDSSNIKQIISPNLRAVLLNKLCHRNIVEVQQFQYIEQAVDKTSWMKKSSMKWYRYGYRANWEDVTVELEQGLQEGTGGAITIHYCPRGKPVIMQINLSDIVCIKKIADPNLQPVFKIHTADKTNKVQPYLMMTSSEAETDEWLSTLLSANAKEWKLKQSVKPGSIWSTTLRGDVYVHQPNSSNVKFYEMYWGQLGGHLKKIETSSAGVTWALGYDYTPWVYTGGFGGGLFRATSAMSKDCHQQTDTRTIYTYENQKWYPVIGYTNKGFLTDCYDWSDSTGRQDRSKETIKLPSSHWQWSCEWCIDFDAPGKVDQEGWQYSGNFNKPFHPQPGIRDRVRRRRWYRKCRLSTVGPWYNTGPTTLRDISLQIDPITSITQQIVLWGVGINGNVLCRVGITMKNPQGESWINIATDLPFTSVSLGGNYRAWGVAKDGSVWYRPGVSSKCLTGTRWLQVIPPPPADAILTYVSAGQTTVWALDTKGNLWFREDITPTFPEGTRWVYICNKVYHVSVGTNDQVMIITGSNFGKNKHGNGMMYNRIGITSDTPSGTGWQMVIGDGWQYVSCRGFNNHTDDKL